jgi:hypothetical protein
MWLLKCLKPDHNTIANFRRDNPKAIKKVFRATVQIAKHFDLIGGKLIAGDSTKLRAQNSKKNNFNQAKIDRHIAYIDNKLQEYTRALSEHDGDDIEKVEEEIKKQQERKDQYRGIEKRLRESGEPQISISDPDSRQIMLRNNITEVCYNVQTTVDAKNNIPIDFKVTNQNDSKAMGNMVQRARSILGTNDFTALYDKGYHTGSELKTAQELGIETIVAIPGVPATSQAPDHDYNYECFKYDPSSDTYTCPQGEVLKTNGKWYTTHGRRNILISFKQYKTKACKSCPARMKCTRSKTGRLIERSIYAEYYERNKKNKEEKEQLYRRRQAIAEHPFGTIKRRWGFSYVLTKRGINRASSDVGLMFIAYNLRCIISILGKDQMMDYLKILVLLFLTVPAFFRRKISRLEASVFQKVFVTYKYNHRLNLFKLTGKRPEKKFLDKLPSGLI